MTTKSTGRNRPACKVFGGSIVGAALIAAALTLSGCSSTDSNSGGSTTCKDFNSYSKSKQHDVVKKMLEDQGSSNPANATINLTRISAAAFCQSAGHDSSTISDINHG
jgi:outer membrane murein-binding lipoprotein Lpp